MANLTSLHAKIAAVRLLAGSDDCAHCTVPDHSLIQDEGLKGNAVGKADARAQASKKHWADAAASLTWKGLKEGSDDGRVYLEKRTSAGDFIPFSSALFASDL